jgi:quinol monooxygenase YgiN
VTTPTDNNPELLTVIASMRAKPGKEAELRTALESLVEPSKADPGNVNYDQHQGTDDPTVFYFYENWESAELLLAHLQSPQLQETVGKAISELVDGEVTITQLRRIA